MRKGKNKATILSKTINRGEESKRLLITLGRTTSKVCNYCILEQALRLESIGDMASKAACHVLDKRGTRLPGLDGEIAMCNPSRAKRDVGASRKTDDELQIVQDDEATPVRIEVATGCD
jgi:hypothetical protein